MTILLETPFEIGDMVKSKLDSEFKYIILNYTITAVDGSGTVLTYLYDCSDAQGVIRCFRPYELDLVERLKV